MSNLRTHLLWQTELAFFFFRNACMTTFVAICTLVVSRFAQMLAVFIPLKIILLINAKQVPGYIANLVAVDKQPYWVAGLTVATLILYFTSIAMDILFTRVTARGISQCIRISFTEESADKNRRKSLRSLYAGACREYAELSVGLIGFACLILLNPVIMVGMVGIILLQFLCTRILLRAQNGVLGRLGRSIVRNPTNYIRYLTAIDYLCLFILLVLNFWATGTMDAVSAVLTILLGRRTFQSMALSARHALRLHNQITDFGYLSPAIIKTHTAT